MLGLNELKESIEVTDTTVGCPVKGCSVRVERRRKTFRREERFECPKHGIYISPSTFEYKDDLDNILWKNKADLDLLERVKNAKRMKEQLSHDNSEDAVTWNVFRFLERTGSLSSLLAGWVKLPVRNPDMIYWSYSRSEQAVWAPLEMARREFELRPARGSEPDLIIKSDGALFFIECKLTAKNKKPPGNIRVREKYETAGGRWYKQVFSSDFNTVAVAEEKYEMMRFWLIGSWIAHLLNLDFYLVNLVLSEREKDIEEIFRKHIKENPQRRFLRATWEDIYHVIQSSETKTKEHDAMTNYFENKTIGYKNGKLKKAFST